MSRLLIEYQGQRLLKKVETQKVNHGYRMIRNAQVRDDFHAGKEIES